MGICCFEIACSYVFKHMYRHAFLYIYVTNMKTFLTFTIYAWNLEAQSVYSWQRGYKAISHSAFILLDWLRYKVKGGIKWAGSIEDIYLLQPHKYSKSKHALYIPLSTDPDI